MRSAGGIRRYFTKLRQPLTAKARRRKGNAKEIEEKEKGQQGIPGSILMLSQVNLGQASSSI
jgi:hypothetical protein